MIRLAPLAAAMVLLVPKAAVAQVLPHGHIDSCLVSATPVAFGTFTGSRIDSTGLIALICEGNGNNNPYTVALSEGNSHSFIDRFMTNGRGDHLHYNLYVDAGRSIIWGNGQGETRLQAGEFNFPGGRPQTARLTVYGRLEHQATPSPGAYGDVITVTVVF